MSNNSLPDVLNVQPMPSIQTMNIETNQLDPIVINQGFARFVLEKKGILDVGSTFTFSVHPTDATGDNKAFLPVKTGIHALIKRAILKVGTKVLATSDDYAHYQTMKRAFKTNEEKSQKDFVKVGSIDVFEPDNQGTGKYQMKTVNYSNATTATIDPSITLTTSETECPVFSIKLSELFPMMKNVQLPLYLIGEHVSVEITFNKQSSTQTGVIACFQQGYAGGTGIKVGTDNCKFLADYLTYENERMDATAKLVMSDTGLVMPYEDLILTSSNIPKLAVAPVGANVVPQQTTRDLGLSGRNVRSILLHDHIQGSNDLAGIYTADAYNVPDAYNWRINDKLVYSRDVVSEARKANQLSHVFSTNVNCLSAEYSNDLITNKLVTNQPPNQDIITDNTLEGHEQKKLQGKLHFEGVDLSVSPLNVAGAGMLVGQKPVEHIRTIYRTAENNSDRELRYFSLVERMMTLKSGQVMVSA
jgi:hypothetical protein